MAREGTATRAWMSEEGAYIVLLFSRKSCTHFPWNQHVRKDAAIDLAQRRATGEFVGTDAGNVEG